MAYRLAACALAFAALAIAAVARADHAPTLVIPGKRGIPVMIGNYEASWAVVEGDWGLSRPGHMAPTVLGGRFMGRTLDRVQRYYPATGQRPQRGRLEVEPPADRVLPPPAESFSRAWSTADDAVPSADLHTSPNLATEGAYPLILAPQIWPGRRHHP